MRHRCWLLEILDRSSAIDRRSRLVTSGGPGPFVGEGISVEVYNGYFEGFSDNLFTQVLSLYIQ